MRVDMNSEAWQLLDDDEQLALSLKLGQGKSSWESGEIMNKAHYKFLEIEARAKFFLRMFTEHLDLYQEVIPTFIKLEPRFRQYLELTIEKRMGIIPALEEIGDVEFRQRRIRNEVIIKEMLKLYRSRKPAIKNFSLLVFDFDRYNNFRILPHEIQEPSAFKRRNKNNDKKNIKNIMSINTYTIEKIIERYRVVNDPKPLFMPVFSPFVEEHHSIVEVSKAKKVIQELSRVGFYLFTRREKAQHFWDLLYNYDIKANKHCKHGQHFWPLYRKAMQQAINYNNIQKRIPSRKFLESALRDLDFKLIEKLKNPS